MISTLIQTLGTALFAVAILHTFSVKRFLHWARKFPHGSWQANLLHLLGEVEVVFGFWAVILLTVFFVIDGPSSMGAYVGRLNFTEPLFVFVILLIASTKPVIHFAEWGIALFAKLLPLRRYSVFYVACLFLGPLLGSFITEPAAMTVVATILGKEFFQRAVSKKFKYVTLAVLFVNVSIGGVLTHYAAPPVLMVASVWQWDTPFMFSHFGWKAVIGVVLNALGAAYLLKKELREVSVHPNLHLQSHWGLTCLHLGFLVFIVLNAHHPVSFLAGFLFFLGLAQVTQKHQSKLKWKEGILVAVFLAGLVIFGPLQTWWLQPLLAKMGEATLFVGSALLTALLDNAALTYLGSQVGDLSEVMKYALVAGAVTGGGLTIIANAPNPAGYSLLKDFFGKEGVSPMGLFLYALLPTIVAASCFWFL